MFGHTAAMAKTLDSLLTVTGEVDLSAYDSRATTGFDGKKADALKQLAALGEELSDLQEKLFAGGRAGTSPARVLVVLQGMDTSGKGGIIRHVAGLVDPQGLAITSFKKPTPEELEHDFLWRVESRLPEPGMIGVFDRSHYEDVLIGRVRRLAGPEEIERRYGAINDFEKAFTDSGGILVKCFLHITKDDQKERLAARLDDPTKHWKYNPGDLDERMLWDDYQHAYALALQRCSTDHAPWHLVPSGRKWYRNWAVAQLLMDQLRGLDLTWPDADYDVEAEKTRLAEM
ncbi:phosphate--nucleotide phosphotransferase [Aeromicrobium sp. Root236]|nr:phosphate--nucleotide phosphotransferase [Aeromicrobium sp. Root236]